MTEICDTCRFRNTHYTDTPCSMCFDGDRYQKDELQERALVMIKLLDDRTDVLSKEVLDELKFLLGRLIK